jgi:hypothetical protein
MLDAQREPASLEQRLWTVIETTESDQAARILVAAMEKGEI